MLRLVVILLGAYLVAADSSCPEGYTYFVGNCYKVARATVTSYFDALFLCDDDDAILAEINYVRENSFIVSMINNFGAADVYGAQAGFVDRRDDGYVWADSGEPVAYSNWVNGTTPENPDSMMCVYLLPSEGWAWDLQFCAKEELDQLYVCEINASEVE